MGIKLQGIRQIVEQQVYEKSQQLAKEDGFVSKSDITQNEAKKSSDVLASSRRFFLETFGTDRMEPFMERLLADVAEDVRKSIVPELYTETVAEIREQKGKGARVGVHELTNAIMAKMEQMWETYNQQAGSGKVFLSREEISQIQDSDQDIGEATFKAWNTLLQVQRAERKTKARVIAEKEALETPLQGLDDWNKLSAMQMKYIVEGVWQHPNVKELDGVEPSAMTPQQKTYVEKLQPTLQEYLQDGASNEGYETVGEPDYYYTFQVLPNGDVVHANITASQELEQDADGWEINVWSEFDHEGVNLRYEAGLE